MTVTSQCQEPFPYIAGVLKGTTSLFNYLAAHPGICPCRTKEPSYFMPRDFPVPSELRQGRHPLADYLELFPPPRRGSCGSKRVRCTTALPEQPD